ASLSRKYSCLEPQADALNQRTSKDAKVRIIFSKILNRRRKRRLGRSKRIPDISARLSRVRPRLQVERMAVVVYVLQILAPDPIIAEGIEARLEILTRAFASNWPDKISQLA